MLKSLFGNRSHNFNNYLRNIHTTLPNKNSLSSLNLFTPQHDELRKTVDKIIEKDINPFVDEWEKANRFPAKDLFKKLGNAGLLGITKPTEYGGLGLDFTYSLAFYEELGKVNCGGVTMGISVHADMTSPALINFGSKELKKEFLVPLIAGDCVSCLGISEASCGSDVAGITTKAVRKGDDLIINGNKKWISNGLQADWMCMLANTNDGPPHKNKSLICVPLNVPGVTRNKIEKIGNWSSDTAEFFFDDVKVPAKNIIGEEGMGFTYQMLQFQDERLIACIGTTATLSRIIQETIEYCKERKAFGQRLIDFQMLHFTLAELQTEIEALRSLTYSAIAAKIDGQNVTLLASMAKLKAGRLAREVTDKCLQFWGGMGYADTRIGRAYRDSRLISIGGGSDEVMLSIICKYMGILPSPSKN